MGRWLGRASWKKKREQLNRIFRKGSSLGRRLEKGLGCAMQVRNLDVRFRAMHFLIYLVQKCYVRR